MSVLRWVWVREGVCGCGGVGVVWRGGCGYR